MLVCDVTGQNSMLHNCYECPGKDKLRDTLDKLFIENDFLEDDPVMYKHWMKKEKFTNLFTLQLTVNDYIEEICCQYDELRAYDFINKAQVSFLCNFNQKLSENECIILFDFA